MFSSVLPKHSLYDLKSTEYYTGVYSHKVRLWGRPSPRPGHQDPINRGTHWQCPASQVMVNPNRHALQLVGPRSGHRGACDRGGVRNGSFPP